MSFLEFRNIRKTYDGKKLIVKDLNLSIEEGEFVTILGPSGSGKTTCLMMLAGFETPTNGTIVLDNEEIQNIPPFKRSIGMVFQNYALFPHMNVKENISYPLKIRKKSKKEIDRRVTEVLDMIQLDGFSSRKPQQLSGGEQQRVAVARALVYHPKLVLMDEPLGALDKRLREQMQYEIKRLHDKIDVTMVSVTHDQTEALTMSDRVAVFNDGEIQQIASPRDLYEKPANQFVANFIGENNSFSGTVVDVDGKFCDVKTASGDVYKSTLCFDGKKEDETVVCIRPEQIIIAPSEGSVDNFVEVKVTEINYLGDHLRILVNFLENTELVIKVPNSYVVDDVKVGEKISIGWTRDYGRALASCQDL